LHNLCIDRNLLPAGIGEGNEWDHPTLLGAVRFCASVMLFGGRAHLGSSAVCDLAPHELFYDVDQLVDQSEERGNCFQKLV
jgi:hypothetical protein